MPFVGEHVTDTEHPAGRDVNWSRSDLSGTISYRAVSIRRRRLSCELIGKLLFPAVDVLGQFGDDGVVHRRHLVLREALLPDRVGPRGGVGCAILRPLLEARVV